MPSILKQFSIEADPPEKSAPKKPLDFLQQKYVTPHQLMVEQTPIKKIKAKKSAGSSGSKTFSAKNYVMQIPTLILGTIGYVVSYTIFKNVQPAAIQNVLFPNAYLPLAFAFGVGHFFTGWYLLQNLRRSFFLTVLLSILLELRLHHSASLLAVILVIMPILALELLLTYKSFRR